MKLGNSGSNNKGKKYIKIKPGAVATPENQVKADRFKKWFGEKYSRLQTELINKDTYDEDILNDTFLRIYDKICFGGLEISDYKAYFHRAFFTNFMQETINQSKSLIKSLENEDREEEECVEEEIYKVKVGLEHDIFEYVYSKYNIQEFEIFKMYVQLKPAVNYATLADITFLSQSRICDIISKIRKDICCQNDFVKRRKVSIGKMKCD